MGKMIYGNEIAVQIRQQLSEQIRQSSKPVTLAVVLVGDDPASASYVKGKEKACAQVGIKTKTYVYPQDSCQEEILSLVKQLNKDETVDGILVQLPLPKQINQDVVVQSIASEKDVDGLTGTSVGKLYRNEETFVPCTPLGIMAILKSLPIELEGKHAVVVGRSHLVGAPVSHLLVDANSTVTICHSKTKDVSYFTKQADILIVAVGKAKFIKKEDVKEEAIVIDVGVNRMADGKLCGDVDTEDVLDKVSYITPVPKGVGPMTITMLLWNTYYAHQRRYHD
ncbi:bifunctional methylenetetrahydrofolate dehydrogenase/methenyltetrahydrofolate cyclohydrolase FolD [Bulleidia sp. zg-1006]|uniref:bifunctional methylenetetrahydrofolate dehydrogenase/methenyltetrahydrofolate cyclohydrolase FolD n=1 Tax=Bulleidia sp. zg-1006 TaxID=2806552 RepID=UPI00193A07A5|nr:bifunctional methylenetetrahydrofolate dehydrogenase/methenyltetrahydrofolate cyclohydrolase FolD [Bulleidia sp. zg-1006]QRG86977.1 bifunctional methylenetetrahydrofolate dehydrogenase/methenyltetrahydrofolate cyclohydrolase FolD [Bulleidia sp. zg-1006]